MHFLVFRYHRNLVETTPIIIGTIPLSNYQMPQPPSKSSYGETDSPTKQDAGDGMYPSIQAPTAPPEELPSYPSPTSNLYPNLGNHNFRSLYFTLITN